MRTFNRLHYMLGLGLVGLATSCGSSNPTTLTISAANFTDVEGKTVKVAIVDVHGKAVVKTFTGTVVAGKFTFTADVSPDTGFRVDAYADDDGDGHCQVGADHVYAADVPDIGEGKAVTVSLSSTTDSRGCLAFGGSTLHVTLTNLPSMATGTVYKAELVNQAKRLVLEANSFTGGTIDFTFDGAMFPGTFYKVDIYIDNNHDDHCTQGDSFFSKASTALPPGQTDGLTGTTVLLTMDGTTDAATSTICAASFP